MKQILLILALCLALSAGCLAEARTPSSTDQFLDNLSKTWDSFLVMAEDAGQGISDWAQESGVTDWANDTVKGIEAWANENGVTAWADETLKALQTWSDESGLTAWSQETAKQFQSFVEENRPAVEAWLAQAGENVTEAWNTLTNPKGHTDAELGQAYRTVVDSLEAAGSQESLGADATAGSEDASESPEKGN